MMDARAPGDAIRITIPIAITVIPIEKRKGNYNRENTIEEIQQRLKEAGWHFKSIPRGLLSIRVRAASPPPPAGLSKRDGLAVWQAASGRLGRYFDGGDGHLPHAGHVPRRRKSLWARAAHGHYHRGAVLGVKRRQPGFYRRKQTRGKVPKWDMLLKQEMPENDVENLPSAIMGCPTAPIDAALPASAR